MQWFDHLFERSARTLAQRSSRRSVLAGLANVLAGSALLPLLPIDRVARAEPAGAAKDEANTCEYWKYCAIDGFLCGCCGGSSASCPPGTAPSPITWIGTCHNPADKRDYIVSYNDCCGKTSCGNCFCNRNEREKPIYRLSRNNDANWCMANANSNYHCSTSVVLGLTEK